MNKTNLAIITENFPKPWSPNDDFLGGSQECVVKLAEELNKYYNVFVFSYGKTKVKTEEKNGILYQDFVKMDLNSEYKNIILFKVDIENDERLEDINIIYWSSDVEDKPKNKYINHYVCLTEYHRKECKWNFAKVIPHGIDKNSLMKNKRETKPNTMLYCSSIGRGLQSIFDNWIELKKNHPHLELYITYGYSIEKKLSATLKKEQEAKEYDSDLQFLCDNLGIHYLGSVNKDRMEQLYWECEYWCLPLNKPQSELFCFNAIKSQFCGCIPVVYKKGALQETVRNYINFDDFVQGDLTIRKGTKIPSYEWSDVVDKYWKQILK